MTTEGSPHWNSSYKTLNDMITVDLQLMITTRTTNCNGTQYAVPLPFPVNVYSEPDLKLVHTLQEAGVIFLMIRPVEL